MLNNKKFNIAKIESYYKCLFENNQEIMLLINPDTSEIEDCNLSACNFYGYSYDEMLKLKTINFNILTKEQVIKEANITKTEQKNYSYSKHRLSNGQVRDVEVRSTPIVLEGNKLFFLIISDTTNGKIYSDNLKIENTRLEKTMAGRTYKLEETNALMEDMIGTLHNANNMLSAILESSPEINIFALDSNYHYLAFNAKHKDTMRTIWRKEIEIGMNMLDAIGRHDDREKAKTRFDRALVGESFTLTEEYGNENLARLYWQDFWSTIFSTEGDVIGLTCFSLDVTKRKQAQVELEASLSLLHASLESTADGILIVGKNGNISLFNQKFVDMWQIPKDILELNVDEKLLKYVDSKIVRSEEFMAKVMELYKHPEESSLDMFNLVDGRIFERYSQPQRVDEEVVGRIWSFRDRTIQKHLEESLLLNQEELTDIIDFLPDATLAINKEGKVIIWNNAIEKMTGIPTTEMIGKGDYAYAIPFYGKARPQLLDLLFLNDEELATQYPKLTREGDALIAEVFCPALYNNKGAWIFAKASPLHDQAGNIIGAIESIRDITDRKQVEETLKESEEQFRATFEQAAVGIAHATLDGKFIRVNQKLCDIVGYNQDELLNMSFIDITHPKDVEDDLGNMTKLLNGDVSTFSMEKRYFKKDSTFIWANLTVSAINQLSGRSTYVMGVVEDITERKRAEEMLKSSEYTFRTLFKDASDAVFIVDNHKIIDCNQACLELFGYDSKNSILDKSAWELSPEKQPDGKLSKDKILELSKNIQENDMTKFEWWYQKNDNTSIIVEIVLTFILLEGRKVIHALCRDIRDRKQMEQNLEYLSYHDPLTGLYNRRFYKEELKRLDTKGNLPITIVVGDVNGLKLINDSFGHAIGDELLKKVAEVIKNGCRADDIIARLGGDEFVVILPKTEVFETDQIIKRINNLASKEKVGTLDISISFGHATKNKKEDIQEVFKKAEDDMYKKKIFESPSLRGKTIGAIVSTLHEKNKREEQHSLRVSALCKSMGEALGLFEYKIEELRSVGLLHDIGKIALDENILNKPGKLTDEEWKEIKRHPEIGYRILSTVNDMSEMAEYVLAHHERWDGKGYPRGLKGDEIPFESRIIAIADAYDAMTSERSYRSVLPEEIAIEELQKNAGVQFDPKLVRVFIEMVLGKEWK